MDFQLEPMGNDSLGIITKAELDVAITTAKSYPRDLQRFLQKTIQDATVTQEIAEKCIYSLPRQGKTLEGPSVHLARICCANFQNLKVAVRVISNDGKSIVAQGVCIDMENNYTASVEVKRSILDRNGNTYSIDMQTVTANAACAIAFRNVVFQVIPSAYISPILDAIKNSAKGSTNDLETRRKNCLQWYANNGIDDRRVCDLVGVIEVSQIGLEELFQLKNMQEGLKSGEITIQSLLADNEGEIGNVENAENAKNAYENDGGSGTKPMDATKPNKADNPKG